MGPKRKAQLAGEKTARPGRQGDESFLMGSVDSSSHVLRVRLKGSFVIRCSERRELPGEPHLKVGVGAGQKGWS